MRKKRIMIIGPANCGKTTLANALNHKVGAVRKTQDMIYKGHTIDVPGAYIENPWMYKHLIAAAQDASHVLILVDQSRCNDVYAPGFAKVFRCPVIGVITKCDVNPENEQRSLRQLEQVGALEIYYKVSVLNEIGLAALKETLCLS